MKKQFQHSYKRLKDDIEEDGELLLSSQEDGAMDPKKLANTKNISDIIGEIGIWHLTISTIALFSCTLGAWNVLGYTFFSYPVDYWCARPPQFANMSVEQWKNFSIPMEEIDGHVRRSQCKMYNDSDERSDHRQEVKCQKWEYDNSFFHDTVKDKWNLVCNDGWLVSMSQTVYMCGFLTAVLVFGQLGDRFGRRPIAMFCVVLLQVAGMAVTFSQSFIFYVITRFLVAMGIHGFYTTVFVILMEVAGPKKRPILSSFMGVGWATGFLSLPGLAWLSRSAFTLQLIIACSSFILTICWCFLPESPRWLLTQGRYEEAERILRKAAIRNGRDDVDLDDKIRSLIHNTEEERKKNSNIPKANLFHLLKTPNMRKKTLIMFYAWFVTSFVYYGLSLNTSSLGGDPFTNFAIAGAVEYPSIILAFLTIWYLGRRKPLVVALFVAGASCLLTIPIGDDLLWLRITLAMMGKMGVSVSFSIVYIYSAELFPTVVRNVGVGTSSTWARVGSSIAPFVKEMGKATSPSVPLGLYGGLTVIGSILVFFLPETMNQPIPDTLEEGESFGKKKKEVCEDTPLHVTSYTK